ncbi:MAG: tetratricopeptide repeat protein [Nannocystaceae bacterium]|nr:tetratricopeptide repeat protein [Myxococcales bacterium]
MPSLPPLDAIGTLLDQGAAESAVRLLRSSWEPELPPDHRARMYCMWTRALCDTGDIEHAVTLARRAAVEFPRHPDILIALGNVLDIRGELPASREAFELAIDVEPDGALQHYNLGAVLERLGDEDAAERAYHRALELDRELGPMLEATSALGALLRRQGRLEDAEQVYDLYLTEDPLNVDILVEHGICLSDLDRYDEALERFKAALCLDRQHPGALYNKAITLYRVGRYARAHEILEQARDADPQNPLTLAVLGSWYLAAPDGNLDDALALLYGALELLDQSYRSGRAHAPYCSIVAEEVFEALWQYGRQAEAREVARTAGQREWITPHILNSLNEADHGRSPQVSAFTVLARVEAGVRPDHWPENSDGYTAGFTVFATSEAEAKDLTLQYLRTIDPAPSVRFHLDVVPPRQVMDDGNIALIDAAAPRPRGVARVETSRSYIFRS